MLENPKSSHCIRIDVYALCRGMGKWIASSSLVNSGLAPLEVVDDVVDVKVNVYRLASSSDKSGQGEKVPIGAETVPIGGKNMPIGVSAGREYKSYNTSTTRVQQARTTPVQHLDDSEFIKLRELSSSSQRVFKALTEDGTLTVRGLASKLNLNKSTVSVAIGRLVKAGFIVRVGAKTFGGHWKVVEENCNENA